ncbi:MAG: hypothetical protein RLY93_00900 [Sumerlaeia bacterium]
MAKKPAKKRTGAVSAPVTGGSTSSARADEKKAAQSRERAERGDFLRKELALRGAGAAVLVALALVAVVHTRRQLAAERLYAEAKSARMADMRSMEITALRKALNETGWDPRLKRELAVAMLADEGTKAAKGQTLNAGNLEEGLGLLNEASRSYDSLAGLLRTRGELALLLSDSYARAGDRERAANAARVAYESFRRASELLPAPRQRREEFYADAVKAAQRSGEQSDALLFLRELEQQTSHAPVEYLDLLDESAAAALQLGMYPQLIREARYYLFQEPESRPMLGLLREIARRDPAMRPAVRATLRGLEAEGKLGEQGRAVLSQVEELTGGDSPAQPTESEAP